MCTDIPENSAVCIMSMDDLTRVKNSHLSGTGCVDLVSDWYSGMAVRESYGPWLQKWEVQTGVEGRM
jgi:hypothetical protein